MKITSNGISLTVFGLVIAALGVVSPIAWDWWNKRSQLSIETKSNIAFVASSQPIKNLEFMYNGRKIAELQKVALLIRNSGRTPIVKEDVVSPLTVNFVADEILEATLVRQAPQNLNASISTQKNLVTFAFALLNPGDEAEIEVLMAGKYAGYTAEARIKNIDAVAISNPARTINIRSDLGLGVYVAGTFGLIFVLGGIAIFAEIPAKRKARSEFEEGSHRLLSAQSEMEAGHYFKSDMGFLSGSNKRVVGQRIVGAVWPLDDQARTDIAKIAIGGIDAENSFFPGLFAIAIGGIAIWYVFSNLLG